MKPTRISLYPYKMGSAGGKLLADEMKIKRVFPNRLFKPVQGDVVINWGNGYKPQWDGKHFLFINRPEAICRAVNKIDSFYAFMAAGIKTPVWTQHHEWAAKWIKNGEWAVARTQVEGFDGKGIKLCKTLEELPKDCNLFTKYVPIDNEFRVYVVRDKVIDVLEKRRTDIDLADPYIRTEGNHWIHCQNPKWWPKAAESEAIAAIKALGLDFGGVDIIHNKEKDSTLVLEVNTAPGIYGKIPFKFKEALLELIEKAA